ncbi:MAG: hypothetical protein PIR02_09725 [Microbacterium enclense]
MTVLPADSHGQPASDARGTFALRWATYIAAFSSSWTGAAFGGFNVVDYALGVTLVLFVGVAFFQRRRLHVFTWMLVPLVAAAIVSAWNTIVKDATFDAVMLLRIFLTMVSVAVIIFSLNEWIGGDYLRRLLTVWIAGIVANALAAIAVSYGIVSLSGILTQATGERLSGLASHPNSLAFSVCLAIAPCVFLLSTGRAKIAWMLCLAVILWGGTLSESRAALLVGLPVLSVALVITLSRSRLRSLAWPVLILGVVAAWFVLPLVLSNSRLSDGAGALSDAGRVSLNENALRLFLQSPLTGEGFDSQSGVSVPLTVLTAGGILFALGYYAFVFAPLPVLWLHRQTSIAPYGLVTVLALIGFGFFNPVFMERATYWPILIAMALCIKAGTSTTMARSLHESRPTGFTPR